ncbi:MAG: DUF1792 domain-containing protein [Butyrivibrio sp.]|nr:DUF1792 domain-containing protein [Butyrivibrio sp.]
MDNEEYKSLIGKLDILEEENLSIKKWQGDVTGLLGKMIKNAEKSQRDIEVLKHLNYINSIRVESMPYELRDEEVSSSVFVPAFLTAKETRDDVILRKKSIGRYGDGEFGIIAGIQRWNFQRKSDKLAERLLEVLKADDDDFLVGLNTTFYRNLEDLPEIEADAVREYMRPSVRKMHAKILDINKVYADARCFSIHTQEEVDEIRGLWDQRDCIFVEGKYTRMGIGNDLFDNCGSIKRILCPAENAFDKYDEILEAVKKMPKDALVLLALGPTATVLAYDLYKAGYWAVDIGHIDLYYEKMIRNLERLDYVAIPYKYCNGDEVGDKRIIQDVEDDEYSRQIVEVIT